MELRVDQVGAATVLRVKGRLMREEAACLKIEARRILSEGRDLVLDLSEVAFTDSDGLSALVALRKTANSQGRRFVLTDLRFNLFALLELTRLHRIFEVFPDVESATAAFEEAGT